ncbi:SDR family oxidoreductase [Reichenbachiella ulvae]|uniref:SDR family NAD(P)-dependent oxidoreductase n=1 Tax=Reichenbachiella ulvae TaxID=2980104 RepID=A0ABT3CX07_9BACT|nr:SDR family NAD(P)-dependent oxidoreductase [Reichenbachiella ulvae]MCV9388240.1 SDR family NAD(P)-dependent oxidoreductase [Reichenbachiella ulvae]
MKLKRNKILITGGSKGIGKEMALRFLALGNQVIITGRNTYALRSLQEAYPQLIIYQCDLNKSEEINGLLDFVKADHPDLNILINNAGVQFNYDLSEKNKVMHWVYEEMSTNLIAPINLATGLIEVLEKNENSAIVNVSSALAFVPKQSAPIYSASKAGLHNFTQVLRYQLEGRIKVFELIPPLVDTGMTNGRGSGKISPKELVSAFVYAFQQDQFEINVGKVKVLRWLHRLYPSGAERMMRFK